MSEQTRNRAPIREFADRLELLVSLYDGHKGESDERIRRRVLVTGVRVLALELVARVVDGPACVTHEWTTKLARRSFDAALKRLERGRYAALEAYLQPPKGA